MPRARSPNRDKAREMWLESGKTRKLSDIATALNVPENKVRKWKTLDKWDRERSTYTKGSAPHTGAPKGNRNAAGNSGGPGAPPGNKRPVKHGAYESIYLDALPDEERAMYESIPDADSLAEEIRLLRLKLSRLVGQETMTTYDMYGHEHTHKMTEQERTAGIMACIDALRKLIKAHKQIEIAQAKLLQMSGDESEPLDLTPLIDALRSTAAEDWREPDDADDTQ